MTDRVLNIFYKNARLGKKSLAVLLDPDKLDATALAERIDAFQTAKVDLIFVGGSLISSENLNFVLKELKIKTNIPLVIFPGNGMHINPNADAILLLSLISGRNPEFLIGQHVISAPHLKRSGLEILPTAYMLVDGGKPTTVSYISNTQALPNNKPDIAVCTAMAGEMLGLRLIYMDAGSGAEISVSEDLIRQVKKNTSSPLIIGGGINTASKASKALAAGADVLVIGDAIEKKTNFLFEIAKLIQNYNLSLAQ
jgi:phosphoglycerol geranylgeranyltransferase